MPEDEVHSSDTIQAGWLVVKGHWYEQVQRSPRGYRPREVRLYQAHHEASSPHGPWREPLVGVAATGVPCDDCPREDAGREVEGEDRRRSGGCIPEYRRSCSCQLSRVSWSKEVPRPSDI